MCRENSVMSHERYARLIKKKITKNSPFVLVFSRRNETPIDPYHPAAASCAKITIISLPAAQ